MSIPEFKPLPFKSLDELREAHERGTQFACVFSWGMEPIVDFVWEECASPLYQVGFMLARGGSIWGAFSGETCVGAAAYVVYAEPADPNAAMLARDGAPVVASITPAPTFYEQQKSSDGLLTVASDRRSFVWGA